MLNFKFLDRACQDLKTHEKSSIMDKFELLFQNTNKLDYPYAVMPDLLKIILNTLIKLCKIIQNWWSVQVLLMNNNYQTD